MKALSAESLQLHRGGAPTQLPLLSGVAHAHRCLNLRRDWGGSEQSACKTH
eukprot:CAMPEP_0180783936 /NCGR_PEP_ID=MMETSP1038_2-20121128/49309_1 /TAXON_ID=632150 /ORGANISM="Azadinium spinosum, Strain 3D9" /LENGTH=50 /DNA_ID=CAMNT_0022820577 /DNA_START=98 /DNA_END=247 /DNA_ORIENTATION=-